MAQTENSGGLCDYYLCPVDNPQRGGQAAYVAECEDIIQALGLTFDEGCEFKSIWRRARARQGFAKAESNALRDAQKACHYAGRILRFEEAKQPPIDLPGATDRDGFNRYNGEDIPELSHGKLIDLKFRGGLVIRCQKFNSDSTAWRPSKTMPSSDIVGWRLSSD